MRVIKIGQYGVITHTRVLVVGWVLVAVSLMLAVMALTTGPADVGVFDSMRAAVGIRTGGSADFIVGQLRAPRTYTTALIGAIFGLAGALLQSITRNPLASPDFIGISAGAGTGAVAVIALLGTSSTWLVAGGAAAGGLFAAVIITALSWHRGIVPLRLILTGIGIGFVASAISQYFLMIVNINVADQALVWLVGSTNARTWTHVFVATAVLVVLGPIALWQARALRTMEMGDDTASALGIHVNRSRLIIAIVAVLLTAGATAVVGPVAFIALVAPALARRLTRVGGVTLITSALMGTALTLAADFAAQRATGTLQLPIGIYTAAIGAPYLLYLVWRASRGEQS